MAAAAAAAAAHEIRAYSDAGGHFHVERFHVGLFTVMRKMSPGFTIRMSSSKAES